LARRVAPRCCRSCSPSGIVSRLLSGWICDRIGGLRTLLLGSVLQGVALLLFLPFDGLASPVHRVGDVRPVPGRHRALLRHHRARVLPASEAGAKVGLVIMCTLLGMALGGWMSGMVFDLTGSYRAAFLNGIAWNALNLTIALSCCAAASPRGLRFRHRISGSRLPEEKALP
jgi:MFS family permease